MPADERIVDENLVADYLGIAPGEPVEVDPGRLPIAVNLRTLSTSAGKFVAATDIIDCLNAFAQRNDLPLMADVARQIAEATGAKPSVRLERI